MVESRCRHEQDLLTRDGLNSGICFLSSVLSPLDISGGFSNVVEFSWILPFAMQKLGCSGYSNGGSLTINLGIF